MRNTLCFQKIDHTRLTIAVDENMYNIIFFPRYSLLRSLRTSHAENAARVKGRDTVCWRSAYLYMYLNINSIHQITGSLYTSIVNVEDGLNLLIFSNRIGSTGAIFIFPTCILQKNVQTCVFWTDTISYSSILCRDWLSAAYDGASWFVYKPSWRVCYS